jgi:hypothetical protein
LEAKDSIIEDLQRSVLSMEETISSMKATSEREVA